MLWVSDIDGTLLNEQRETSSATRQAIRRRLELGDRFILCSSRPPASMRSIEAEFSEQPDHLVAFNGGLVLDPDDQPILDVSIETDSVEEIVALGVDSGLHVSVYCGDDWWASHDDRWSARESRNTRVSPSEIGNGHPRPGRLGRAHKVMCMGDPAAIDEIADRVDSDPEVDGYRAKDTYLEIASASTSKGYALEFLLERFAIKASESVFFGDNFNDIPAMQVAGMSVAVGNARPAVLDAADHVTGSNWDDGVATFLLRPAAHEEDLNL